MIKMLELVPYSPANLVFNSIFPIPLKVNIWSRLRKYEHLRVILKYPENSDCPGTQNKGERRNGEKSQPAHSVMNFLGWQLGTGEGCSHCSQGGPALCHENDQLRNVLRFSGLAEWFKNKIKVCVTGLS